MTILERITNWDADIHLSWLSIFLLFIPLGLRLLWDRHTIVKLGKEPNHAYRSVVTGLAILVVSEFVCLINDLPWHALWRPAAKSYGEFILFFDYWLNLLRPDKKWYYTDEGRDGKTNFTDRIYNHLGPLYTLLLKLFIYMVALAICYFGSYVGEWSRQDTVTTLSILAIVASFYVIMKRRT